MISFEQKILIVLPTDEEKSHFLLLVGVISRDTVQQLVPQIPQLENSGWASNIRSAQLSNGFMSRKMRSPSLPPLHHQLRSSHSVLCKINSIQVEAKCPDIPVIYRGWGRLPVFGSLLGLWAAEQILVHEQGLSAGVWSPGAEQHGAATFTVREWGRERRRRRCSS